MIVTLRHRPHRGKSASNATFGLPASTGLSESVALSTDIDSSFGDVFDKLDVAAALQPEARNGR